jgi:prepilin-type N-terminal cleavage/methylation domain-containing protein
MNILALKNKKGVTLLELMTVIGIISIMSVVLFVSMQNGRTEKELEIAARNIASSIRAVQSDAINGKKALGCSSGYLFYWGDDGGGSRTETKYQYKIDGCNPQPTVTLDRGVYFAAFGSFEFQAVSASPVFSGGINWIVIKKDSKNYIICVSDRGNVTEKAGTSC